MTNENRSIRKNITQPADWWEAFEAAARTSGMTLSEWIGEAGAKRLPLHIRKNLSERQGAGRPTEGEKSS